MISPLSFKQSCLDVWSLKEKFRLSNVVRSVAGEQNWVSVSRQMRQLCHDETRPLDWFSQKNCAAQYQKLLEGVSMPTPKRKRGANSSNSGNPTAEKTVHDVINENLKKAYIAELEELIPEIECQVSALEADVALLEDDSIELTDEQLCAIEKREEANLIVDREKEQQYQEFLEVREKRKQALQLALKQRVSTSPKKDQAARSSSVSPKKGRALLKSPVKVDITESLTQEEKVNASPSDKDGEQEAGPQAQEEKLNMSPNDKDGEQEAGPLTQEEKVNMSPNQPQTQERKENESHNDKVKEQESGPQTQEKKVNESLIDKGIEPKSAPQTQDNKVNESPNDKTGEQKSAPETEEKNLNDSFNDKTGNHESAPETEEKKVNVSLNIAEEQESGEQKSKEDEIVGSKNLEVESESDQKKITDEQKTDSSNGHEANSGIPDCSEQEELDNKSTVVKTDSEVSAPSASKISDDKPLEVSSSKLPDEEDNIGEPEALNKPEKKSSETSDETNSKFSENKNVVETLTSTDNEASEMQEPLNSPNKEHNIKSPEKDSLCREGLVSPEKAVIALEQKSPVKKEEPAEKIDGEDDACSQKLVDKEEQNIEREKDSKSDEKSAGSKKSSDQTAGSDNFDTEVETALIGEDIKEEQEWEQREKRAPNGMNAGETKEDEASKPDCSIIGSSEGLGKHESETKDCIDMEKHPQAHESEISIDSKMSMSQEKKTDEKVDDQAKDQKSEEMQESYSKNSEEEQTPKKEPMDVCSEVKEDISAARPRSSRSSRTTRSSKSDEEFPLPAPSRTKARTTSEKSDETVKSGDTESAGDTATGVLAPGILPEHPRVSRLRGSDSESSTSSSSTTTTSARGTTRRQSSRGASRQDSPTRAGSPSFTGVKEENQDRSGNESSSSNTSRSSRSRKSLATASSSSARQAGEKTRSSNDDTDTSSPETWRKRGQTLLADMKEHQFADTFAQAPCNEDYAGVVRKPMDLESIRKGIDSGEISDIKELERDVSLVFLNSTMSNKSGSKVNDRGLTMYRECLRIIQEFKSTSNVLECTESIPTKPGSGLLSRQASYSGSSSQHSLVDNAPSRKRAGSFTAGETSAAKKRRK